MKPLIVALDVETAQEALALAKRLSPHVDLLKVGPVLFLKYGGSFLQDLRALGPQIFLDLKFHDIPSVTRRAVERAGEWGVYSATIHASGGAAMMREAAQAAGRPRLWGVTVLTSLDERDLRAVNVALSVEQQALHLARLAAGAGLDGVIASAGEARAIRGACGPSFQIVTPGIRMAAAGDDQKRIQTPAEAVRSGADFFVMGRPILEAPDPVRAVQDVYRALGASV